MSLTTSGQLDVHLHQRLLHPLDVRPGALDQALPMAHVGAQRDDGLGGTKTPAQQADAVEVAEPLAVGHVALPSRDVLDVARVDEQDLEAAGFEDLVDRDPVHPGGFHRDAGHPTGDQPVREAQQIAGERL